MNKMDLKKRDLIPKAKFTDLLDSPTDNTQARKLDQGSDQLQNDSAGVSVPGKDSSPNVQNTSYAPLKQRLGQKQLHSDLEGVQEDDFSLLSEREGFDNIRSPDDQQEYPENLSEEAQNDDNFEGQGGSRKSSERVELNAGDLKDNNVSSYSEESEDEKESDDDNKNNQEEFGVENDDTFYKEEFEDRFNDKQKGNTEQNIKDDSFSPNKKKENMLDHLIDSTENIKMKTKDDSSSPDKNKNNWRGRLIDYIKNIIKSNKKNKIAQSPAEEKSNLIPNSPESLDSPDLKVNIVNGNTPNGLEQQEKTKEPPKTSKKKSKPLYHKKKNKNIKENVSEKERIQKNLLLRREKINKAINMRTLARYLWLLFYGVLFGFLVGGAMAFLLEENNFISYSNTNLSFNLDKCTLLISDHQDSSIQSPVYAIYQVPRKIDAASLTSVDINLASDPQKITIYNPFEQEYCQVKLFVKSGTSLGSLTVSCSSCNIIQDTSFQLQITNNVSIAGSMVHANFRNLQASLFTYEAITGYLQLNNIDTTSTSNTIKIKGQGDIVIQSAQDFNVDATTDTQAFCFNGPSVQKVSATNCAISGDSTTYSSINNTGCQVVYDICASSSCTTSRPKYTVSSTQGNVYANLIPSVGQPVASGNSPAYGRTYDNGIGLNAVAQGTINGLNDLIAQNPNSSPFAILHLGDIESQSSRYTKWVLASNPSYALMRPWWISTFSASVLNGNRVEGKGLLLPGYCPFIPEYTTENLLEVQQLLLKKISVDTALVTFVNDKEMPVPPTSRRSSTGIFHYVQKWTSFDNWYSLTRSTTGEIFLKNNDFTDKGIILAAILVSFIIAGIVSFQTVQLVVYAILHMYSKLAGFANHLKTYSKLDQSKVQRALEDNKTTNQNKKPDEEIQRKNVKNLIKRSPSPSAFIDYLVLIIYRQFSNSVSQYYRLLFKEVNESEINDQELDPGRDTIRGTEAKILYEKFCFINYLYEKKLTYPKNVLLLQKYGFEIVDREDLPTEVFIKINIKNYDNFLVNPAKEGENLNSLELYIRENVQITEFEEDHVEVETFITLYNKFCDYNRLPRIIISPSLMKDVFNINMIMVPQQYIKRKTQDGNDLLQRTLWNRISVCLNRHPKKKKTYIIDTSRLENHFKLIMDKITDFANDDELDDATVDLILYPNWIIWDGISVLFHILQGVILIAPIIALVVLNESEYAPWSLKDPAYLITFLDFIRDPANLVVNLYSCSFWNVTMMILVSVLWVVSFLDLLLYYWVMEFPQDKSFQRSADQGERFLQKIGRQLEWILVLIFLTIYLSYIAILITWLMFGALIDPNTFLPFATAAATFVTFVWTKYQFFKNLASKGEEAIMNYLRELFGGFTSNILKRLAGSLENITKEALSEGKTFLQSKAFKDTANSLVETGLVDAKTIAEYTQKIENLDSKTIISEAGVIINDPTRAIKEMTSTIFSLKERIVEKVKEECEKRKIPPSLVEIIVYVALKDSAGIKNAAKKVVEEYGAKKAMGKESIDIIMELLFSQCVNKEEKIKFITNKIIEITFNTLKLSDLTPEMFILMFDNFSNLQEMKIDSFVDGLKELLSEVKEKKENTISQIEPFVQVLDIISVLGEGRADFWKLKHPSLNLLYSVLSSSKDEQKKIIIKNTAKFLLLISSNFEVPSDLDTNQPLEAQDMKTIIKHFCTSIGLTEKFCDDHGNLDCEIVPSLIHFAISYARHETVELPKDVIKDLEGLLDLKRLGRNDFVPFCLELTNNIFVYQAKFYRQIHKCCENFNLNKHLKNFIKALTCYGFDDYETHYPNINITQNPYFVKIAEHLKLSPALIQGLLDLIYHKYNNKSISSFLKAVMSRMGLNRDKLRYLKHILNLFLSEDEAVLLQATKAFRLNYTEFLLVGKGILNPRFVETEKYKKVGIKSEGLIAQKKNVYNFPEEHYSHWKFNLRKEIDEIPEDEGDSDNVKEKPLKEIEAIHLEKLQAEKNLVKFYLEDWKTQSFSRKKITDYLNILDNEENKIKKMLISQEKGTLNTGVDFLATVLCVKSIQLSKKERYKLFDKEKDHAVSLLADCLSVNSESFKKFIQMLVLNDVNEVLKCFLHFFPEEKENEIVIKKSLSYTFQEVTTLRGQINFLTKQLPEKIEFVTNKHLSIPGGLFSKMFYDSSKVNFEISDVLELSSLLVSEYNAGKDSEELKLNAERKEESLMKICYTLARFAKGIIPAKRLTTEFGVMDKSIIKIIKLLSIPERSIRMRLLTQLFEDKYHPLKVMIALHGLFTQVDFQVRSLKTTHSGFKKTEKFEEESIKSYLSNLLDLYPEAFGIFELAFERNVSKFIQKALPIMRRVNGSSFVDVNLMESLLSLSVGEHFNTTYIANRLDISPDIISFFISLARLAYNPNRRDNIQIRKKELNDIVGSVSAKKVLTKLKVKPLELVALLRLVLNLFETNASVADAMGDLGLKRNMGSATEKSITIDIDLMNGLIALDKSFDPEANLFENRKALQNLKSKTNSFFSLVGLGTNIENAFIISRLVAGNFLVLLDYSQKLDWAFPYKDTIAGPLIRSLTMGICGLVNTTAKVEDDLSGEVEKFVTNLHYLSLEEFAKDQIEFQPTNKTLPNNNLAYAVYMTYQALEISPVWIQAFLFDKKAFTSIHTNIPKLHPEFILVIVLNIIHMPDIFGDLWGLYEWNLKCKEFCENADPNKRYQSWSEYCMKTIKTDIYGALCVLLRDKVTFDYEKVVALAKASGITGGKYWKDLLLVGNFNTKINESLLYLLIYMENYEKEKVKDIKRNIEENIQAITEEVIQEINKENIEKNIPVENPEKTQAKIQERVQKKIQNKIDEKIQEQIEKEFAETSQEAHAYIKKHPVNFLVKYTQGFPKTEKSSQTDLNQTIYSSKSGDVIRKVLVACYKCVAEGFKFKGNEKPVPGYELTNFCMLGTIVNLRNRFSLKMSYERILYNLHQLSANIERKLYLNPYFFKMSKFKLMKLVGASIGIQVSNIVEWCLPPSLFSPDYAAKLAQKDDKDKQKIMVEQCEKVALTYNDKILLGDLGKLGGTYNNYKNNISRLVKADDWDSTNLLLNLSESYVGNPNEDPQTVYNKIRNGIPNEETELFKECTVKSSEKIYYSKELVSQIYSKQQTVPNKEKLKETYESAKTGLNYKIEEKRSLAFEFAIMDADMMLIMGVTVGDLSVLSRGEHIISAGEDGKKKAKIYKALFGLKSFRKSYEKDRKQLKEYLTAIASVATIESDLSKLEEIIMFTVTGKVAINEMLNALEISDHSDNVLDLLFMSLKEETDKIDNYEQENMINPREVIARALDIQEHDLETFNLIRNIYLLNKKDGWIPLIGKLRKDLKDKDKNDKTMMLIKLIEMLDFKKIKKQAGTSKNQDIINFMRFKEKDIDKVFTKIFKEAVLLNINLFPDNTFYKKSEFLLKAYEIIQNLVNGRIPKLFELIMLTPETIKVLKFSKWPSRKSTELKEKPVFDMLLHLFGISSDNEEIKNDIKILKIFLTIGNGDLTAFQSHKRYQEVIKTVVTDLTTSKLMKQKGIEGETQKLSELLVGSLIWDIKLIIKAFIHEKTIKEAYLLYSLYGCVFLNNLLSYGEKYVKQAQTCLKVLLSTVVKKIMSPAAASGFLRNSENTFDGIFKKEFEKIDQSEIPKVLNKKFDDLFTVVNSLKDKKQPKSLFSHICRYFDAQESKTLTLWPENPEKPEDESYELVSNIMIYFCDGSIVVRLLNTVVRDNEVRDLLWKLIRFALKVIQKLFIRADLNIPTDEVLDHFKDFMDCLQKFQKDGIWGEVLKMTEFVMKIYLTHQSKVNTELEKSKVEVIKVVKELLTFYIKNETQRKLFLDIISVVLGLNMENFEKSGSNMKFDLTSKERMELFFAKVLPAIFPSLEVFTERDFERIYDLITTLNTEYIYNLHNPQKLREIVKDISKLLEKYAGCDRTLIISIIKLMESDLSGFKDLAKVLLSADKKEENKSQIEKKVELSTDQIKQNESQIAKKVERMAAYLNSVKDIMDFDFNNKLSQPVDGKMANLNSNNKVSQESWNVIIKKVKEGTAKSKELFDILDLSGKNDGTVDEKEFTSLAFRLGFRLSQHRIKEIIAKVKGTEARPGTEHQLNEKEFEEALGYLQTKNLLNALQILHISPEQLTAIFVWLVILLIFIFIFIFLGIKAFAIGGTFGSIVNSLFPAAGGLALGKNKDADKEIINKSNVKGASDTAFKITAFEEL